MKYRLADSEVEPVVTLCAEDARWFATVTIVHDGASVHVTRTVRDLGLLGGVRRTLIAAETLITIDTAYRIVARTCTSMRDAAC